MILLVFKKKTNCLWGLLSVFGCFRCFGLTSPCNSGKPGAVSTAVLESSEGLGGSSDSADAEPGPAGDGLL